MIRGRLTRDMAAIEIHTGDAFDVLDTLPDASVHACVTDPPYGLAFMGRDWDDFEPREYQDWCEEWARQVKRVLKPGGHLLAFSGNRTHHRLFTGVEDAGFEIRDTLTWHYGSGFPKAADVSKVIDKRCDAEREVVGEHPQPAANDPGGNALNMSKRGMPDSAQVTAPATDAAREWDGWKTGLKPATEFVVMARKPFDGATVDCVVEHGTGALNIEACRVGVDGKRPNRESYQKTSSDKYGAGIDGCVANGETTEGRYPANVVFDETTAEALDRENEHTSSSPNARVNSEESHNESKYGDASEGGRVSHGHDDSGGPSRYFYTSKASRAERTLDGRIDNAHPTVKPGDLMEWLVKLVTREGQTVLDPFTGSGTTGRAAKSLGRGFIGIEKQPKWADVARVRCGLTPDDPANVRADDAQAGLAEF